MISKAMEEFFEFIDNQLLVDLSLIGARYTWFRSEDSSFGRGGKRAIAVSMSSCLRRRLNGDLGWEVQSLTVSGKKI